MTSDQLIGQVVAAYLRERLAGDDGEGTARYLLDCLTSDQAAAVARAILDDAVLSRSVEIKFPIHFVSAYGLPAEILTNERTTYFRNAKCDKPALLLANTGDDEEQSLKELVPIGGVQLEGYPELWVELAARDLGLSEQHKGWWKKAIQGLLDVRAFALDRFADYILQTRKAIENGEPMLCALGVAFPALRVPKDTTYFKGLSEKHVGYISKWKTLYTHAFKKRSCYLLKQTSSQTLLTEDDLAVVFAKVKDDIPEQVHPAVNTFIRANSGWNEAAKELAQCEWEWVKPLFDGLRREKFNLGKATLAFYDERESDLLTTSERDYLARLVERKTTEAQDEDEDFYRDHRQELKEQASLKARWDRFIFGAPVETEEFLVGVALCFESLFDQDFQGSKRKLRIRCDRRTKKDLRELNIDAGQYFARRYRGLRTLLGNRISWDVGELFSYEQVEQEWRSAKKPYVNRSVSKAALQLKFFLELEVELSNGDTGIYSKQLTWRFNPNAVSNEFQRDWSRLVEHPLVYCRANREPISGKGRFQSLDLTDVKTLVPTFDKDRGSFVAVYKKEADISLVWLRNLAVVQEQGLLDERTSSQLLSLFQAFQGSYSLAIQNFAQDGLAGDSLIQQVKDYCSLLHSICKDAKGDRNRALLLRPLLELGIVSVEGGKATAIVAPWHPLRLAAIAIKARQVAGLVKHLLTAEEVLFGDTRLFFKELREELGHPYYPEVVLCWSETRPELLCLNDYYLDYSLHESPIVTNEGSDDTNESPSESGNLIVDLTRRYLTLYPHEQANLSVVLYNCDSARLPHALVNKLNELHEDEEDMRCEVVLRHRDGQKLRDLYEKITESADSDADSFVASEATRDFMARLRIGIMVDQAPVPDPKDGPPKDIVFLQDVIARHSRLEWYPETAKPIPIEDLIPSRWSRRRPSPSDDMKSVVYLCCPVQSQEGWAFLTALTTFLKGDWDGNEQKRLLPARQLDFNEPATASIFKEVHNLGNWVVNYDELLDRRQLINQNVKVIRYKQAATQGRNLLISSTAPLGLLRSMVLSRAKDLNLELSEQDYQALADRFINDANEISGDIVLRAAKRGRNASELMGVVLSRHVMRHELGVTQRYGWYFLDDYADWLGQREEQIADILALSPNLDSSGKIRLDVLISEAKYIDAGSLSIKRKESQKQLRDTVRRIGDALFGDPRRLDRDLWLSRFSDLVLNGIRFPATSMMDLAGWRRAIREGDCNIFLRGYSHIFVSGPVDASECSDFAKVAELNDAYQEVFSRANLRKIVLSYWKNEDPTPIRRDVAGEDIWSTRTYRRPTGKIVINNKPDNGADGDGRGGGTSVPGSSKPPPPEPSLAAGQLSPMAGQAEQPKASALTKWPYPGIEKLITESELAQPGDSIDSEWLKRVESQCKGAIQQFQLQAKLRNSLLTPNAALLKFQGSANLTVEQVLRRRSEFLTTHGLNIISVRAEPGVVALSIARPNRQVVRLLEVWKGWAPNCANGNCELLIGVREEDGRPLFMSPKRNAPHTLIAGSTGSGKSVLMQNIVLGIGATNTPEQAQLVLIDPKLGVDYFGFEGLPHLQGNIIDKQKEAIEVLKKLVGEMDRRYAVLKKNKVANIFDLNSSRPAKERLPFLWIIHDEFAEWMLTPEYSNAVSDIVARLGVKARAAGIFLVFAAQRPDAGVMPMQLRANLGNRLILRVDGEGTSEIALGEKGAERLLGKGHMAAKLEGEDSILTAQVPFISPENLAAMVAAMRS